MQLNNTRILKNAGFLYFRMLLTLSISLYTVRLVYSGLGVLDFGIYNVVGGVVVLSAFFSTALSTAAQRYISFHLVGSSQTELRQLIGTFMTVYLSAAVVILISMESAGLWLFNHKLNIPPDRMDAARISFHLSNVTFLSSFVGSLYTAILVSRENMKVYAYVSLLESALKLGAAAVIVHSAHDKLVVYSILIAISVLLVNVAFAGSCLVKYPESRTWFHCRKDVLREVVSYSGWSILGALTGVLNEEGLNILSNIFFGPTINAARGITSRVSSTIVLFSSNLYAAFTPQITKSYAEGDKQRVRDLVSWSSRASFCLLLLVAMPIFAESDFILAIWLHNKSSMAVTFTRLVIIFLLINTFELPLSQVVRATGKIRTYQITMGSATLLITPLSYLLLRTFPDPRVPYYTLTGIYFAATFVRIGFVKRIVGIGYRSYLSGIFLPCLAILLLCMVGSAAVQVSMSPGWLRLAAITATSTAILFATAFLFGISAKERHTIRTFATASFAKFSGFRT